MNKTKNIFLFAGVVAALASCGPVHFLTQTKTVPRRYSVNYNHPNVLSERSELNRKAWVVYSDRAGNVTTARPGGNLPFRELQYMEPMYVIGRRGDYYKLIKYDPAVLGSTMFGSEGLKKQKEAEFYGWVHKDFLLLFNNSATEVRNGIKLKSLAAITDCGVMLEAENYFKADSLMFYSGPKLEEAIGSVSLGSMVYVLKTAEDGSRVMVAQKTTITPDEVAGMKIGWVASSLVAPFGQRLTLSAPPVVETASPEADSLREGRPTVSPVSLSPALYAHRVDTTLVFRTLDASEILDHSDNRIYNVDGKPITWRDGREITSTLEDINVIFTFVPTENVIARMPILSNAIQNLKPVFENPLGRFNYSYAAVIGGESLDFESDYLSFSDRLIETARRIDTLKTSGLTEALRGGLALAACRPDATNIIVVAGEKAPQLDSLPQDIHDGFVRYNGRLLSYQVYTDNADTYNNFVLQSLDVIESYAERNLTSKRAITVYADQLRPENRFLEGAKNAYALDFPARSMTQGMVIFPEKGKFAEPELLIGGVDSLVRQVELDNLTLISSLDRAFAQVGQHRSRFQPAVAEQLDLESQTRIAPYVGKAFSEISPDLVEVTDRTRIVVDSLGMSTVGLLLTEAELEEIKVWVEALASMKPDIRGEITSDRQKARNVRRVRRDLRGVPADVSDENQATATEVAADSLAPVRYAPTGKIRRHIRSLYLQELRGCVFEGRPRRMTLAQAQEYITTMPTISPQLNGEIIKNLTRKKRFSDDELVLLIEYFEKHKGLIESDAVPVKDLTVPGGEKFFFLPSRAMP